MPLNVSALEESLEALFASAPLAEAECAQLWADALQAYATAIVPASVNVTTGAAAVVPALTGMGASGAAVTILPSALTAFAATVGTGMAPAFSGTPPAAPWVPPFAPTTISAREAASTLASSIDAWMRTGTATPSSGGTPVPWS